MVAFRLRNTLSEHGTVSRGVCATTPDGYLSSIREHTAIARRGGGIHEKMGVGSVTTFSGDERVSMNLWGFRPSLFAEVEGGFSDFLQHHHHDLKAEYQLPRVVDAMVRERRATVRVLDTEASWFGVTYREDGPAATERLREMAARGAPPPPPRAPTPPPPPPPPR